ncbi:MAG: CBS domain-containing protein [Actinomycetota bacterium]|nr:CBS domain-containing protein [Actinomycetota bacterium]
MWSWQVVAALEGIEDSRAVEEVMREGPATVRPSEELDALVGQMRHAGVDAVVVTRSDGRLLGLLERAAAERHLDERGG